MFSELFPHVGKHSVKDYPTVLRFKVMIINEDLGWSWHETGDFALLFAQDQILHTVKLFDSCGILEAKEL